MTTNAERTRRNAKQALASSYKDLALKAKARGNFVVAMAAARRYRAITRELSSLEFCDGTRCNEVKSTCQWGC